MMTNAEKYERIEQVVKRTYPEVDKPSSCVLAIARILLDLDESPQSHTVRVGDFVANVAGVVLQVVAVRGESYDGVTQEGRAVCGSSTFRARPIAAWNRP